MKLEILLAVTIHAAVDCVVNLYKTEKPTTEIEITKIIILYKIYRFRCGIRTVPCADSTKRDLYAEDFHLASKALINNIKGASHFQTLTSVVFCPPTLYEVID